jgi:hypothetical protein
MCRDIIFILNIKNKKSNKGCIPIKKYFSCNHVVPTPEPTVEPEDEPEEERREIVERVDDDSYDNQQAACVLISLQRRAIEVVVSYNDNLKDCDNQYNPKNAAEVFIEHFRVLLVIGFE